MKFETHNTNKNSLAHMLNASSHSKEDRHLDDFYATPPKVVEMLLDKLPEEDKKNLGLIWEPCAGMNHITDVLRNRGYEVFTSDLNVLVDGVIEQDFFEIDAEFLAKYGLINKKFSFITNPPYKFANDWYKKSMELLPEGGYMIQFVKIQFLETKKRHELLKKWKPKYIYGFWERWSCAKGGDFKGSDGRGGVAMYAWIVTQKGYDGPTIYESIPD